MTTGHDDLLRAAETLASRVPEPLGPLARLAYNYRWSWSPDGHDSSARSTPRAGTLRASNPVRLLQEAAPERLERAAGDGALLERIAALDAEVRVRPERPRGRRGRRRRSTRSPTSAPSSASTSRCRSTPAASARSPATSSRRRPTARCRSSRSACMYRQGYFRQRIDAGGWQHEYWVDTDPERLPAALVTGDDGAPLTITVPVRGLEVTAQIWRVDVGRVPLLPARHRAPGERRRGPLDHVAALRRRARPRGSRSTSCSASAACARSRRSAIDPGVAAPQRGPRGVRLARGGARPTAARWTTASRRRAAKTIFTTHTPVPAGNDTYPADQVVEALAGLIGALGVEPERRSSGSAARTPTTSGEPFGVTQFALRTSRARTASAAATARSRASMWRDLWPDRAAEDVPIGHVTNGVHVPTWLGRPMRELLDRHLGDGWLERQDDPATWAGVDDDLRRRPVGGAQPAARGARRLRPPERSRTGSAATSRAATSRPPRGRSTPSVLTIGFARRIATYKRLHLLVQDAETIAARCSANGRPVQLVLAGKAHPRDDDGKRMVQHLFRLQVGAGDRRARRLPRRLRPRSSAARMVRGCDVWLNLPRPPLEASGTSGMKSVMNGGLQLSVLDGWWAEAYDGDNGWALPGDVGPRPRRAGRARRRRAAPAARAGGRARVLRPRRRRHPARLARARARVAARPTGRRSRATRMMRDYVDQFYSAPAAR